MDFSETMSKFQVQGQGYLWKNIYHIPYIIIIKMVIIFVFSIVNHFEILFENNSQVPIIGWPKIITIKNEQNYNND